MATLFQMMTRTPMAWGESSRNEYVSPMNAFSRLSQHEVIAFKSWWPVSHISSEEQLEAYESYYLRMRAVMDSYPDKTLLVVKPAPLNPASTDLKVAARARAIATWLRSDECLEGYANVFTFDIFGCFAENDASSADHNMPRQDFRDGTDSHPNRIASEAIGPLFADFVVDAVGRYRSLYHNAISIE